MMKINKTNCIIVHGCPADSSEEKNKEYAKHWLGETKRTINKLILVAPWKISDEEDKFRKLFYGYPVDK